MLPTDVAKRQHAKAITKSLGFIGVSLEFEEPGNRLAYTLRRFKQVQRSGRDGSVSTFFALFFLGKSPVLLGVTLLSEIHKAKSSSGRGSTPQRLGGRI